MGFRDDDIARLRQATDIVALVSESTALKRRGKGFWGLCPFHSEKTPSFKVDPATGLFYCFGCREGGDVIAFVQKTKGLGFAEAVELLADRAGIQLRASAGGRGGDAAISRKRLHEAVVVAQDFYHRQLLESPSAAEARQYLASRRIGEADIAKFRIGYAPDRWDTLVTHLRNRGFSDKTLIEAGLAIRSTTGRLVDFFRHRIVFPIADVTGRPVAFGGRSIGEPREGEPKYRNSPTTKLYDKSEALFALHLARKAILESRRAVVVEGYTDVIALHSVGVAEAVATCGTALSVGHVKRLCRSVAPDRFSGALLQLVLVFDGDPAGKAAAERACEQVFSSGEAQMLDVKVVEMPDGYDPAELARVDEPRMRKLLKEGKPAMQFLIDRVVEGLPLDSPESRVAAARAAMAQLLKHPDPAVREGLVREVAHGPTQLPVPGRRDAGSGYRQYIAELVGLSENEISEVFRTLRRRWPAGDRSGGRGVGARKGSAGTQGMANSVDASRAGLWGELPSVDLELLQVLVHGSGESRELLGRLDSLEAMDSEAGSMAMRALVETDFDPRLALERLRGSEEAVRLLTRAVAEEPAFEGDDRLRWERQIIGAAERKLLERQSARALEKGDLRQFYEAQRRLKNVGTGFGRDTR